MAKLIKHQSHNCFYIVIHRFYGRSEIHTKVFISTPLFSFNYVFSRFFLKKIWSLALLYLVFVLDLREKKKVLENKQSVRKLMVGSDFNDKNYGF
jgi:uncharacterized membrane protein